MKYIFITNPEAPGSCWLWGYYATISGNAGAVPVITPRPIYATEFTLPADVQNFTTSEDGDLGINFQTNLTVDEALEFYRLAFTDQGLTEREINTAITETTFSLVFDGHPDGKAVVVQGVDLGNGTTNINIRFEDV